MFAGIRAAILVVVLATAGLGAQVPRQVVAIDRPNIVVVVTDDMRDSDWQGLPQTAAFFAERGTVYPNFFATTPVCCPSRATILTGMYAHNHGVLRNDGRNGGFARFNRSRLSDDTIAHALRGAGYRTALIGKFLNGTSASGNPPVGWDRWFATSELAYYGFALNDNGKANSFPKNERAYVTEVLSREAVKFIEQTDSAQPLFLFFTPKAPHLPALPARQDRGAFAGVKAGKSEAFNEADVSDKPPFVRAERPFDARKINKFDRLEERRLESLLSVDRAITDIVDALEAADRLDNSLIMVMSDNGFMMGDHRLRSKGFPYDGSVRVTMMAAGPGIPTGGRDGRLVATTDIAPTVAEAAGIDLPRADGRSLRADARSALLLRRWSPRPWMAIRTRDHLYVEWDGGFRELYDLAADPHELDNLLAPGATPSPETLSLAAAFSARLGELQSCERATCAAAEDAPIL